MPRTKRRNPEIVQVNLRLPKEFRQRLWDEAENSGRSFNQEIMHRLDESFKREAIDELIRKHGLVVEKSNKLLDEILAAEREADETIEELRKIEKDVAIRETRIMIAGMKK